MIERDLQLAVDNFDLTRPFGWISRFVMNRKLHQLLKQQPQPHHFW